MKVEANQQSGFNPITLKIEIESEDELETIRKTFQHRTSALVGIVPDQNVLEQIRVLNDILSVLKLH